MNDDHDPLADLNAAIEDEAIGWFVRMRGDVDATLKAKFDSWCSASPAHQRAYQWAEAHFAASASVKTSSKIETDWHHRPRYWLAAALAAALLLVVGLQVNRTVSIDDKRLAYADTVKSLVTAAREIRTWHLSDGSSVTLDADSRVEIAMTSDTRRLRLRKGKARFSVVRERRPFVVEAAAGAVTADQAVFDIAYDRTDRVTVNLISGRADMHGLIQPAVYMVPDRTLQLGKPVFYPANAFSPAPATDTGADTRDWPDGWVEYRSIALKDLVAQANRYADHRIVIDDVAAGEISASGRFKLTDTDAFESRISEALNLSVQHRSDEIHLSRR